MGSASLRRAAKQEYWRKLLEDQASSRLSVLKFCELRKVSQQSFYAWRKKLPRGAAMEGLPSQQERQSPGFAQVAVLPTRLTAANTSNSLPITIRLPNDVRIEVPREVDRHTLREVLAALREASC